MDDEPFVGSVAVARGLVTPGRLRGPGYRRLLPDIHIRAGVRISPAIRARAAALFAEQHGGAAAGSSSAELLGASCTPWNAPAEIVAPVRIRNRPGLVAHRGTVHDTGIVDGVRVTSPLRTGWDLARGEDPVEAVVALDALAACGRDRPTFVPLGAGVAVTPELLARSRRRSPSPGFDPARLLDLRAARPGCRGAGALERIVELADPRAESPQETRLRLLLVHSGLPTPEVQYRLHDARGVAWVRFDLAYPDVLLAIEYDGEEHDDPLDRVRDTRTSALGWHTLRIAADGLTRNAGRTVHTVRELRAHRAYLAH